MLINGKEYEIGPGVDLRGANLSGADLRGFSLFKANLCGTDMRGANVCGVDMRGASFDKNTKTTGWKYDKKTRFPHDKIKKIEDGNAEDFWNLVDKTGVGGCWNWLGAVKNNHYIDPDANKSYDFGIGIRLEGCKTLAAHRQVFFLHTDEELPLDIDVSPFGEYGCGNRLCVNPDHLYVGPQGSDKVRMIDLF